MLEKKLKDDPYLKGLSYELFMLMLSILALVNIGLELFANNDSIKNVSMIMQSFIGLFFMYDFIYRFITVPSKKTYLIHKYGWADFLAAIPLNSFSIFRVLRIFKVSRALGTLGIRSTVRVLSSQVANSTLYGVFFIMIMVVEFGAIGVLFAESGAPGANITNASDALWWAFVSITTVGYGDTYPVTNAGRLVGVVTIACGVGLFGTVSGYLANTFLKFK
jgi:voltage-gated potassium channel